MGKTYKEMRSEPKWERVNKRVINEEDYVDSSDDYVEKRNDKLRRTRDAKDKPKAFRREI